MLREYGGPENPKLEDNVPELQVSGSTLLIRQASVRMLHESSLPSKVVHGGIVVLVVADLSESILRFPVQAFRFSKIALRAVYLTKVG